MYIDCKKCGFSQDDFWDKKYYNPAVSLLDWMDILLNKDKVNMDAGVQNKKITYRELIAQEFENYANIIREQKWVTYEHFCDDNPEMKCPNCGSTLNID